MLRSLFISISLFLAFNSFSQEEDMLIVGGTIADGDTIPMVQLKEVTILSWINLSSSEARKMTKLIRNVKITYPYARLAGIKLEEYKDILLAAPDDKARRKIMKQVEDELQAEYGQELRELTVSQGKILLKLVDRETGASSYDLVADLRGEFRAVFYQTFARFFGLNMKMRYDPEGEDREIENIVIMIENGQL
ncbi:MAG: DUF4294 domain-containing protein [Bacteroidales bacterium]|nr:DUF4294 domain-containing protein [Bacteroidales bacterium]